MITFGTGPDAAIPISDPVPDPRWFSAPSERANLERALDYMGLRPGRPLLGAPVDSALCVATNDPDAPLVEVALAGASEGAALSVGDEAPDFALPDLDGRWRRLSERRGRPVLLTFFASW